MNLPNFINFEPFNRLRSKMHAHALGHFDVRDYGKAQDKSKPAGRRPAPTRSKDHD